MAISKDESTPIEQLRKYCSEGDGKQDWQERLIYVIEASMLGNFSDSKKSSEALGVLLDGLSEEDSNRVIVGLIHHEWERAKGSDPATFMRSSSLPKTAMMHHFKNAINSDSQFANKFVENPVEFVKKLQLPDHLQEEFNIILNDLKNDSQDSSVYLFAHNIIFGGLTGPLVNHFNVILVNAQEELRNAEKLLKTLSVKEGVSQEELSAAKSEVKRLTSECREHRGNFDKVRSATDVFVNVNNVITSSGRLQKEQGNTTKSAEQQKEDMQSAVSSLLKKQINPDTVSSYVIALDKFMSNTSKDYKSGAVTMDALDNMKYYSATFNSQSKSTVVHNDSGIQAKVKDFVKAVVNKLNEVVANLKKLSLPSWVKVHQVGAALSKNKAEDVKTSDESKQESGRGFGRR